MANQTVLSNLAARSLFLATAIPNNYVTPSQAYNSTGNTVFVLPNQGTTHGLRVHYGGTMIAGTAAATAGNRWPFSLHSAIQFIDPSNITRINIKPWHAYQLMLVKRFAWFFTEMLNIMPNSGDTVRQYNNFVNYILNPLPLGTIGTGSNTNVVGYVDVPIILGHNDMRGALRLDTVNAQSQVILTPPATFSSGTAGLDIPITLGASGTITSAMTVALEYLFWDPVMVQVNPGEVPQVPYPTDDMRYVHELASTFVAGGISAGQETRWNFPTNRQLFRIFHDYNDAGAIRDFSTGPDIQQIRFLINATTPKETWSVDQYLKRYFEKTGRVPSDQFIYWDFFRHPWSSIQYSQLQTGVTFASTADVAGGAGMEIMTEGLYLVS